MRAKTTQWGKNKYKEIIFGIGETSTEIMLSAIVLAAGVLAYAPMAPYNQDFLDNYNVLKYLGNGGPYNTRRGLGIDLDAPEGCSVDQVALIMRHGERYPDPGPAKKFNQVWDKFAEKKGSFINDLEFVNYWEPFVSPDSASISQESTVGAYSGLQTGYTAGTIYRQRYGHLVDLDSITPVFPSGSERIVDTARRFVEGFFGYNVSSAAINIIPEVAGQGANTLVPVCNNASIEKPNKDACSWKGDYPPFHALAKKWNKAYGLNLTWSDISTLCLAAGYELQVRGGSPWVNAIPRDVWIAYEHQLSSSFWCESGPGSPEALARGSVWANATRELFLQGPEKSLPLLLSFSHETDISPILAFLGLDAAPGMNKSHVQADSGFHLSDVVPMGTRFILERLVCTSDETDKTGFANANPPAYNATYISSNATKPSNATDAGDGKSYYVRVVSNDAVVPINDCLSGPGFSCPLQEYSDYVDRRLEGRDFSKVCNLTAGAPDYLDFIWNYNTTTELNNINTTVAYQALNLNYLGQAI